MHEMVTATGCMHTHAAVRQLALVITEDAGRVYLYQSIQSFAMQQCAHHFLSSRGTANIAEANK
jgi:hypothetical protein